MYNKSNIGMGHSLLNKRAFTLIELLAVIVILAIIALIAVPIVLNIINGSKKSSILRSAELYIHAVDTYIADQQLYNVLIEDNEYSIEDFSKVEVNGQVPSDGMIEVLDGKTIDYSLQMEGYVVNYDKTQKKPIIGGTLRKFQYKDSTGAKVDVIEGLTPVVYQDNNWKVADTSKEWYNYSKQEWANAVILNSDVSKNAGDTVDVANEVKAMFVYVPRYEYKVEDGYGTHTDGTEGTQKLPGEIKVNFLSKDTTKANQGYIMHPAFTFGDKELNGIWVGKFETTGIGDNPTILPGVTSLRSQNTSIQFATAQKFNSYITNGDSHMMKNSEWGAAAYLSQSKYGKYGNANYSGAEKEVRINNCDQYITGIGADSQNEGSSTQTCTTNTYETVKGQTASTTGNITGIYDMSGGAYEYVMGNYNSMVSSSGFPTLPNTKYLDTYTTTTATTACNGGVCYGQALSETKGWYRDSTNFISSSNPWFGRGGNYSVTTSAGVFGFYYNSGVGSINVSFRVVIS